MTEIRFVERSSGPREFSRREWLRIGGFGGTGLAAFQRLQADSGAGDRFPGFGRAKSVIVVFASGGQSQLELWDPKPSAPLEVRGEFGTIPSSVPGTRLGEHMPRIARLADRFTIVRTMSHEDLDHGSAFYLSMSGRYYSRLSSNPPPKPTDHPTHGAILKRVRPESPLIHPAVHINAPAQVPIVIGPGQFGGFLGREFDPMIIGDVTAERVVFPDLAPRDDVPTVRMESRQTLLSALDGFRSAVERDRTLLDQQTLYSQAFDMLSRPETRNAFNLDAEPTTVRDRYGRNRAGQACLLARRLAEVGVPLITVMFNHTNRGQDDDPDSTDAYGWDTHNDIFYALKSHLMPRFDVGFSALLEDLDERGMLDETLVVCMGEFGRAPLVALEPRFAGATPGRKHWAAAYSIVMAGAGVSRGHVVGRTDRHAAYPVETKFAPWDVQATLFSALGVDPTGHYVDPADRPYPISIGRVMRELYAG